MKIIDKVKLAKRLLVLEEDSDNELSFHVEIEESMTTIVENGDRWKMPSYTAQVRIGRGGTVWTDHIFTKSFSKKDLIAHTPWKEADKLFKLIKQAI